MPPRLATSKNGNIYRTQRGTIQGAEIGFGPTRCLQEPLSGTKEEDVHSDVKKFDVTAVKQWLTRDVTIKLPGWALALGGLVVLVLVLD